MIYWSLLHLGFRNDILAGSGSLGLSAFTSALGPVRAPPVCESRNREDDARQSSLARPLHPLAYGLQYHGNITLDVLQFA